MSVNKSFPMTDDSFGAKLASFKARVDGAVESALEFEPVGAALAAVNYRRYGGLHFANVAGVNLQWSFKKRATKKIAAVESTPCKEGDHVDLQNGIVGERFNRFIAKRAE
jgi:hypothetical protein